MNHMLALKKVIISQHGCVVYNDCRGKEQTTKSASDPKFHQRFHVQWNIGVLKYIYSEHNG